MLLAIVMWACADATDETQRVVVAPADRPQAWVVVEAIQTECCYDEGSTGVLEITNRDGFRMAELSFANPVPLPDEQFVGRFDRLPVGLGPHTVMLWQEGCGGGCPWNEGGDNTRLVAAAEGVPRRSLRHHDRHRARRDRGGGPVVAVRRVSVDRGPLGSLIGGMTRTSQVLRDRTTLAVMSKPVGPYTPIVRGGDLLFTAGQVGIADGAIVEGGLAAELRQVFVNLRSVLSAPMPRSTMW